MIKCLVCSIIILSYGYSATELPEGFYPFGIQKTVFSRITRELDSFSCEGEHKKQHEDMKSKCNDISQFLEIHKNRQTKEKTTELLDLIDKVCLSISDKEGHPLELECIRYVCGGHKFSKMYSSHSEAQESKPEWDTEYKNKDGINPRSVTLYDIKQHGSKTAVVGGAAATGVYAGAGCVGLAGLCEAAAATAATGGAAAPVFAFMLVWNAGWWTGVSGIAADTKHEYDKIQYEMSLGYEHEETALSNCDNKRKKLYNKSTSGLIKALNHLFKIVKIFEIECLIEEFKKKNLATDTLRADMDDLRRQIEAFK